MESEVRNHADILAAELLKAISGGGVVSPELRQQLINALNVETVRSGASESLSKQESSNLKSPEEGKDLIFEACLGVVKKSWDIYKTEGGLQNAERFDQYEEEIINRRAAMIMQDAQKLCIPWVKPYGIDHKLGRYDYEGHFIRGQENDWDLGKMAADIYKKYSELKCLPSVIKSNKAEDCIQIFSHPDDPSSSVIIANFWVTNNLHDTRGGFTTIMLVAKKDSNLCNELKSANGRLDLWATSFQNAGMAIDQRTAVFFDANYSGPSYSTHQHAAWVLDYDNLNVNRYLGDTDNNPKKEVQSTHYNDPSKFAHDISTDKGPMYSATYDQEGLSTSFNNYINFRSKDRLGYNRLHIDQAFMYYQQKQI